MLRGQGSEATTLECQTTEGCLEVRGAPAGDYADIQGGLEQGSEQITVIHDRSPIR